MIHTFYIRTFGCQMNEHDSDRMGQLLSARGWTEASTPRGAGLIIVNSCSVRAKPEHKALSEAGRYRRAREKRGTRIILAGCVAQQEGRKLLERAPYLDAVIGPDAVGRLPEVLAGIEEGRGPVLDVGAHDQANPGFVALCPGHKPRLCSFVTIMKGCNNFCSYCVVPNVRGREVSRPRSEILAEVEALGSGGCCEVTLLGQNVNSYRDASGAGFPELIEALERQGVVDRIRFTTSHPKDFGPELVRALAGGRRLCEHVHLALQSGSDRVLSRMNRGYTGAQFTEKALSLRAAVPGVSITTDLIVGFPGEEERDFQDTLEVVERVAFDLAFSFKYSLRPNTAAAEQPDDVPPFVKARRLDALQKLLAGLERESLKKLVGGEREVLVEGGSVRDPAALTGRTRCNRVVNFTAAPGIGPGDLRQVKILQAREHTLWGECL